jgi:hypothetical protein
VRTINPTALAKAQEQYGLESVLIVRAYWNAAFYDYADKSDLEAGIFGRVLQISGLEDVVSVDGSSTSASISITLDDSDGQIKGIIDFIDVHKKRIQVLQWFAGMPKENAFVIFDGEVNSPFEWNESDRTFTFNVVSPIENRELGFSFEEGQFQGLTKNVIGKPWPLVFGTALKVPALQFTESPEGVVAEGFAIVYKDVYDAEITELAIQQAEASKNQQLLFIAGAGEEIKASGYNDGFDNEFSPPDDIDLYNQHKAAAAQAFLASQQFFIEAVNLGLQIQAIRDDYEEKKAYAKSQVKIASENFPRGTNVVVELGSAGRFNVRFDGIVMTILSEIDPPNNAPKPVAMTRASFTTAAQKFTHTESETKFKWIDGGTKIRVISNPIFYVGAFGNSQIQAVYAKQKGLRVRVPNDEFTIQSRTFTNEGGFTAVAQVIRMNRPLTSILNQENEPMWDDDDVWCDVVSDVPPQFIHIMFWTIALFTNLQADPDSFNTVFNQTVNTPMNFAIFERKNALEFIKELCFQARVAIWINGGTIFLRYLPAEPVPIETITYDDIIEDSFSITSVDTESLITKLTALWRYDHSQESENKVIVRYNIDKYGIKEEEVDFYAFNNVELVRRSAAFWAVRMGTSWKKLRFRTGIHKLKIEANDPVRFEDMDFLFARDDVTGIVERATYDSTNNQIEMEVWVPVPWGSLDQAKFAYTANTTELFGTANDPEFRTGNPFQDVKDDTNFVGEARINVVQMSNTNQDTGFGYDVSDAAINTNIDTALVDVNVEFQRPAGLSTANNKTTTQIKDPVFPSVSGENISSNVKHGFTVGAGSGNVYTVDLLNGKRITARQLQIRSGFTIPPGTAVTCIKEGNVWNMQAAVWLREGSGL